MEIIHLGIREEKDMAYMVCADKDNVELITINKEQISTPKEKHRIEKGDSLNLTENGSFTLEKASDKIVFFPQIRKELFLEAKKWISDVQNIIQESTKIPAEEEEVALGAEELVIGIKTIIYKTPDKTISSLFLLSRDFLRDNNNVHLVLKDDSIFLASTEDHEGEEVMNLEKISDFRIENKEKIKKDIDGINNMIKSKQDDIKKGLSLTEENVSIMKKEGIIGDSARQLWIDTFLQGLCEREEDLSPIFRKADFRKADQAVSEFSKRVGKNSHNFQI